MVLQHILKHASGRRTFRRAFPSELRPFVPSREHKVSLGLEGSPGFLARYEEALADFEAIVATAKRRYAGTYDPLDAPMIAYLAKVFEGDWHEGEEKALARGGAELADKTLEGWRWMLDEYKQARVERDFDAMEAWWGSAARGRLASRKLVIDPADHQGFQRLCDALNDTVIGLSDASKARMAGNIVPVLPRAQPVTPGAPRRGQEGRCADPRHL